MTVQPSDDWNRDDCTSWCGDGNHNHDPACWGGDSVVLLSMEDGFPREAVEPYDVAKLYSGGAAPTVGVYAYRSQPGYREVVYLHLSRTSNNEHLDLDCSVHLTGKEAVQLANYLLATAVVVDPDLGQAGASAIKACTTCDEDGLIYEHPPEAPLVCHHAYAGDS